MKIFKLLSAYTFIVMSACSSALTTSNNSRLEIKNASGVVTRYGPSAGNKIGLSGEGDQVTYICKNSVQNTLSSLINLTVKIIGKYDIKNDCFEGDEFVIVKTSTGRIPIVGKMTLSKKKYVIQAKNMAEKRNFYFEKIPSGLKKYMNRLVIIDAVPSRDKDGYYKIVSYMKHP